MRTGEKVEAESVGIPHTKLAFDACRDCQDDWDEWSEVLRLDARDEGGKGRPGLVTRRQHRAGEPPLGDADEGIEADRAKPGHQRRWCDYCTTPQLFRTPRGRNAHITSAHRDRIDQCPVPDCEARSDDVPFHLASNNDLAHGAYKRSVAPSVTFQQHQIGEVAR